MTTQDYIIRHVFPVAAELLPRHMSSAPAWAMLVAIGRQESAFKHRRQINGPARGFWQFEEAGGVAGVLEHPSTRDAAAGVLYALSYRTVTPKIVHTALEHNDVLACCFARLLLWTSAGALPMAGDAERGWAMYLHTWRPGKPFPDTWAHHFSVGWSVDWPGTVKV